MDTIFIILCGNIDFPAGDRDIPLDLYREFFLQKDYFKMVLLREIKDNLNA
jgi:hypothetical protein